MRRVETILSKPIEKGKEVFISPTATVIGEVTLGDECSVWYGAVLRGDSDRIGIGARSNIQDNATVHVDPNCPAIIGEEVIVGHGAIVHGATIGNNVLIGMHATILNRAKIGNWCIIGAHALVTEDMEIPDNSIVLGSPAKVVRQLTPEHMEKVKNNAEAYVQLSKSYLMHYES